MSIKKALFLIFISFTLLIANCIEGNIHSLEFSDKETVVTLKDKLLVAKSAFNFDKQTKINNLLMVAKQSNLNIKLCPDETAFDTITINNNLHFNNDKDITDRNGIVREIEIKSYSSGKERLFITIVFKDGSQMMRSQQLEFNTTTSGTQNTGIEYPLSYAIVSLLSENIVRIEDISNDDKFQIITLRRRKKLH